MTRKSGPQPSIARFVTGASPRFVECPICGRSMHHLTLNVHLDTVCLAPTPAAQQQAQPQAGRMAVAVVATAAAAALKQPAVLPPPQLPSELPPRPTQQQGPDGQEEHGAAAQAQQALNSSRRPRPWPWQEQKCVATAYRSGGRQEGLTAGLTAGGCAVFCGAVRAGGGLSASRAGPPTAAAAPGRRAWVGEDAMVDWQQQCGTAGAVQQDISPLPADSRQCSWC
jgi:hypothetical protein